MIWGATEESSITEIQSGDEVVYPAGSTPIPALFFGTAKTFEVLAEQWDKGVKVGWFDFPDLREGETFSLRTRGPIKAIALLCYRGDVRRAVVI